MKKYKIILLGLIFLIGCSKGPGKDDLLLDKYKAAYSDLVSNDKFVSTSSFYDVETVVNKIKDNKFRVDTIIDNPKVAMYNIQIIAEIDSTGVEQYEDVVPSLGIVDQTAYNLIPFQVNQDEGFYGGLVVSGISDNSQGEVILEIIWTDYAGTKSYQEYIKLNYDIDNEIEEESDEDLEEDLEADEVDESEDE